MKQLLSLVALCVMAGCSKKDVSSSSLKRVKNKKSLVSEKEAKLFDLPVPFDAVPLKGWDSSDSYAYRSKMAMDELVEYTEEEMEILGWKLVTKFADKEAALVFEKPSKYSTISIRPSGSTNLIVIFNTNK